MLLQEHGWKGRHLGLRDNPHEVCLARHLDRRSCDELARLHRRMRKITRCVLHILKQLPGGCHSRSGGCHHSATDRLAHRTSEAIAFACRITGLRACAAHATWVKTRKRSMPERDRCQKEIVTQFAFLLWVKLFQKGKGVKKHGRGGHSEVQVKGGQGGEVVAESFSQSVITTGTLLPTEHTWALHTLIFCTTSVRWNLSILWFLLAGLALQVDSPSSVSSLRTSGRSPTSGWSSLRTPG